VGPARLRWLDASGVEVWLMRPLEKDGREECRRGRSRAIGFLYGDVEQPATTIPRGRAAVISNHDVAKIPRRSPRHLADLIGRGWVEVHAEPRARHGVSQPEHRGERLP